MSTCDVILPGHNWQSGDLMQNESVSHAYQFVRIYKLEVWALEKENDANPS